MVDRTKIEMLVADIRRQREDAEARATEAANRLARAASGLTPLESINPDEVDAAADDYTSAVRELRLLEAFAGELRRLLM